MSFHTYNVYKYLFRYRLRNDAMRSNRVACASPQQLKQSKIPYISLYVHMGDW